ncbi:Nuclear pore complex component [Cordyceps fumosorosea ARSEF 2679]|uniref:Nuclear pore complex component n=1 Tax=Cordyceps fumosorosea (strain ARSEF 2679) TaxID=1081104 RepID=A0A162LLS2_CORFA|nr:Nuclear pore complex component [Cordyceps fumosorosea ARSEF 2679]OAA72504.1 Nuclear pore complex component [Cordyceps fumosorosea ARSEF 2679]
MSTPARSTPVKAAPASVTDSPGTWRHPRLNEITRRREATTFSEKNIRRIAYNILALLTFWALRALVKLYISPQHFSPSARLYINWVWTAVQVVPLAQVALACTPLLRARDEMTDIPLTAAQRKLLGLAPAPPPASPSAAAAADLVFSTPPRYSRTPSIAGSVGSRGSYSNSPLSGRGSPFQNSTTGGGSPFSPPVDSPLMPRSGGGGVKLFGSGGGNRRSSSGSPFSASTSVNLLGDPASPSPAGKRTSVGLNSKWLYEKGRRSSGSAWVH